jgi:hypothetical protein
VEPTDTTIRAPRYSFTCISTYRTATLPGQSYSSSLEAYEAGVTGSMTVLAESPSCSFVHYPLPAPAHRLLLTCFLLLLLQISSMSRCCSCCSCLALLHARLFPAHPFPAAPVTCFSDSGWSVVGALVGSFVYVTDTAPTGSPSYVMGSSGNLCFIMLRRPGTVPLLDQSEISLITSGSSTTSLYPKFHQDFLQPTIVATE